MTKTETQQHYEIHTCFKLCFNEKEWGPYYNISEALDFVDLLQYWIDVGLIAVPDEIAVNEYLIREYGLDFIRVAAVLNLR